MSCKLWGKVTSVSLNINFVAKMSILLEKTDYVGRIVDFFIKYALPLKVIIFLQNMPIFFFFLLKCDFLCEGLYKLTKCQNLIKNFNFLGYVNWFMC